MTNGREPPAGNGYPTPVTLEDVEGCFGSLAGVVATESATITKLVKASTAITVYNATLTTSNATLTTSTATLTAFNAKLTKALAKSKGGSGGGADGGSKRGKAKYCPTYNQDTWHKADDCV